MEDTMQDIESRWNEIKQSVRHERELSDVAYNTWIAPLKFYKVENNVAIISIPSDRTHSLDYISKKFMLDFKVAVSEMMNEEYEIENEPTNKVYKKYQEYCIANTLTPLSNGEFSKQVKRHFDFVIVDKTIQRKKYRIFVKG